MKYWYNQTSLYRQLLLLGMIICFTTLTWSEQEIPCELTPEELLDERAFALPTDLIQDLYNNLAAHNPYHNKTATVRVFSEDTILCQEEIDAVKKRSAWCKKGLKKLLNAQFDETSMPNIALCCSGGGIRASVSTAAFIQSLEKEGIFDTIQYVAGLSGSTWTLLPWYASQKPFSKFYPEHLKRIISGFLHKEPEAIIKRLANNLETFTVICLQKLLFKEIPTIIDIYGLCLAFNFFDEDALTNIFDCTLIAQQKQLAKGDRPFPLYTATTGDHIWITFSPYEVSATELGCAVPAWSFGRKFNKGVSVNNAPPLRLDLLAGICGSAISINFAELCTMMIDKMEPRLIFSTLSFIGHSTIIGQQRIFPAKAPNFTYNIKGLPLSEKQHLTLIDAGIDCGIPIPPLLEVDRNIDIIIVLDVSANVIGAPELELAEKYAKKHNLPFPKINYSGINDRPYTIFDDGFYSTAPIIIYVPMGKNKNYSTQFDPQDHLGINGFMNTFNFDYSSENIRLLTGLFEQTARDIKNDFIATVKKVIKRKS